MRMQRNVQKQACIFNVLSHAVQKMRGDAATAIITHVMFPSLVRAQPSRQRELARVQNADPMKRTDTRHWALRWRTSATACPEHA